VFENKKMNATTFPLARTPLSYCRPSHHLSLICFLLFLILSSASGVWSIGRPSFFDRSSRLHRHILSSYFFPTSNRVACHFPPQLPSAKRLGPHVRRNPSPAEFLVIPLISRRACQTPNSDPWTFPFTMILDRPDPTFLHLHSILFFDSFLV